MILCIVCFLHCVLFQRIDDQPAEQLRIEVGALGRHPLAVLADRRIWSTVAGMTRAANSNGPLPHHTGRVARGGIPLLQAFDDFVDRMHVPRLGQVFGCRAACRSPSDAGCDTPSPCQSVRMLGGDFGHLLSAGVGHFGERPAFVLLGEQAERPLLAGRFDFVPDGRRPDRPLRRRRGS